jgi:LPS-assembly lipoprotein
MSSSEAGALIGGRSDRAFGHASGRNPIPTPIIAGIASLLLGLLIGGCGFRPLYKPMPEAAAPGDRAVAGDLASISVSTIPDRSGQQLRNRLQDKLHLPGAGGTPGRYVLHVALGEFQQPLAVRQTGLATRANLYVNATYSMVESATGSAVLNGSSVGIASYDLLDADFATLTAINDARTRVIERLAEDIRNKLAVHFSTAPAVAAAPVPGQPSAVGASPAQPPVVLVPSPATDPTIASPAGTPIDLPPPTSGFGDPPGGRSTPVGPSSTRPSSGGLP